MKDILLLGGIGEAVELARQLLVAGHRVTYSLAGRGRIPRLPCKVRVGGFGGVARLADFLATGTFDLLLDATHPYAAQISHNAAQATQLLKMPLWAYRRPPWHPAAEDDWRPVADWNGILTALKDYQRPFFTLGTEPLNRYQAMQPEQQWLVRCLQQLDSPSSNVEILGARGPFALEQEVELLKRYDIDILVSKNSGGSAVAAKLVAARQLGLPVIMLERPTLPPADQIFTSIDELIASL